MPKLSSQLTEKELRKEIYRLRRELRASVKEVRELSRTSNLIPTYSVSKMRELERRYRSKSVSNMTKAELVSNFRALEYIQGLKSSTVSGALEIAHKFEPFKNELNELPESDRKAFWDAYQRFYNETRGTAERFKYELFDTSVLRTITNRIRNGETASDIATTLVNIFNQSSAEYAYRQQEIIRGIFEGKGAGENNDVILFSSKLKNLL